MYLRIINDKGFKLTWVKIYYFCDENKNFFLRVNAYKSHKIITVIVLHFQSRAYIERPSV